MHFIEEMGQSKQRKFGFGSNILNFGKLFIGLKTYKNPGTIKYGVT